MENLPINEFIKSFDFGIFNSKDISVQIQAGWYDWFCKDSSLRNKTIALTKKLKTLLPSSKIDTENNFVFFKNNCPMIGNLYDDLRICDIKTGDVIYTITPSIGHKTKKGQATVWGAENNFDSPLIEGSWKDIKAYFKETDAN